jgi:alkylation response protein AidB-like acyl-CoA dehydrogenase
MDFTLTPGQRTVQEKARQAAAEVAEKAALLDREGRVPEEILKLWAEAGFFGLSLPKEFGGIGYDYVCYCLAQM